MQTAFPSINRINPARPWYTQVWPWLLMLGPAVVVVAATYTGWLAFSRQDALVVADYYKQGLAINQDLQRDRVATSMGLSLNGRYDAASGKLNGTLRSFGTPIAGRVLLHLAHPTQPEKDIQLAAQPNQHGDFSIGLPMLERARWEVSVEGERRDWRLSGTWNWPQQQMIALKADLPPAE
jgi:uncharacterized protein